MKTRHTIMVAIIAILIGGAISWGLTMGLFALGCWIFNWAKLYALFGIAPVVFSWKIATAIWALLTIFKMLFGSGSSSKK